MIPSQSILIVEDCDEDYEATVRAFQQAGVHNEIVRCRDGDEALLFLLGKDSHAAGGSVPTPGVILLDLNLPGTDGREVLETVKANPHVRRVPIIVLTTSEDVRDINACYLAGANSYVQKPVDVVRFVEAIQRLRDYWLEFVILPREEYRH